MMKIKYMNYDEESMTFGKIYDVVSVGVDFDVTVINDDGDEFGLYFSEYEVIEND